MFRNDTQRSLVVRLLLRSLGLEHLWTDTGPTDEACELLEARGGYLSSGERVLLLVAFDVWTGEGKAEFQEVLYTLDETRLALVASIMLAMNGGAAAIDRWIATRQQAIRGAS